MGNWEEGGEESFSIPAGEGSGLQTQTKMNFLGMEDETGRRIRQDQPQPCSDFIVKIDQEGVKPLGIQLCL